MIAFYCSERALAAAVYVHGRYSHHAGNAVMSVDQTSPKGDLHKCILHNDIVRLCDSNLDCNPLPHLGQDGGMATVPRRMHRDQFPKRKGRGWPACQGVTKWAVR